MNQKVFSRLVAFLQISEGLTIGILEADTQDVDMVLTELQDHPKCEELQVDVLNCDGPQQRFPLKAIIDALPSFDAQTHKKRVVILRGLEQSIGNEGDYPPVLTSLNYIRDDLVASLPYPLILCLPDDAVMRLARYAPDFWAWKSGVFRFEGANNV